jgi:magnesium transporter
MFFYKDTVITFQEHGPGDVWDPVRERIRRSDAPIRHSGADFLAYALVDAVVDNGFPLIEHYGSVLDEIDAQLLDSPSTELSRRIHAVKRELLLLRRVMWPMRQLVDQLYRDEKSRFTPTTRAFLRDVYEHAVEVLDVIESYREMTSALVEMYMGAMSNRMNEVMKVLTIISTFFIPATFLAGVYGMNFDHFPELHWHYGYVGFWGICGVMTAGLLLFFRRRGWLGGRA